MKIDIEKEINKNEDYSELEIKVTLKVKADKVSDTQEIENACMRLDSNENALLTVLNVINKFNYKRVKEEGAKIADDML